MIASHRWASCGAMALTGDRGGSPLAPDSPAAPVLDDVLAPFGLAAEVLADRANLMGFQRDGTTSCGGATKLVKASDGWLALALARPEDVVALDAAIGVVASTAAHAWPRVSSVVARRNGAEVAAAFSELGVACAVVGEGGGPFVSVGAPAEGSSSRSTCGAPLVVDLSALWAGPLCTDLLGRAGAEVIKVEDPARPDGGRGGGARLFDLLNAGKASVALPFGDPDGLRRLGALVDAADVVVTSSRARAVTQLGLDPDRFLASGRDKVWVAITAHGWRTSRVGFGDDAACAAGLVAWHPVDGEPRFAADAIADPLCGSLAAAEALRCWRAGGRWFIDASLSGAAARVSGAAGSRVAAVAASAAGDPAGERWQLGDITISLPEARRPTGAAAELGTHTLAVLTRFGL